MAGQEGTRNNLSLTSGKKDRSVGGVKWTGDCIAGMMITDGREEALQLARELAITLFYRGQLAWLLSCQPHGGVMSLSSPDVGRPQRESDQVCHTTQPPAPAGSVHTWLSEPFTNSTRY